MSYSVHGSGNAVIMLPGFFTDRSFWNPYLAVLDGFTVVAMDMRGCGDTRSEGPFTIGDMMDDVVRVMDSLGIWSAHVVGWDTGSAVGFALARSHPLRVRSLTMISPVLCDDMRTGTLYRRILDRVMIGTSDIQSLSDAVNTFWASPRQLENGMPVHRVSGDIRPLDLLLHLKATIPGDYEGESLHGVPALTIYGSDDILSDGSCMRRFAEGAGSELLILESEGHIPSPASCMRKIVSFIRSNDG
ncbi:MAG: alpha/beta hydrolase [Candidatus Methanomethylophilaceae archaeon]|nr:alpha/beta hydrolase [Candidatus Methanomethylophilaceae archaeon]